MKNDFLDKGRVNQKLGTRDNILAAAQHFLKVGKEFTLDDIAGYAGISRATVYRYYSNVDELAGEAGLAIKTKTPEALYESNKDRKVSEAVLEVQDYYNNLALEHENAFRKYLAVAIASTSKLKRGARRVKTLQMILKDSKIDKTEKENLIHLLTILMGMEPIIVTKDVCGLDNEQSKDLLKWGMEKILKGMAVEHEL
ncbi:TetR/AcrR family transcriptional regulator [Fulvivirga ligni]|uniref:TetR/AcrR family transcriptional regulator n=1 Tax=Fulvivirga ligni TaxID=2904246 RepID=UPI001F4715A1|nr:TetR/AcrR family transcriptional regulator [Fulvivirga ligni]UII20496.1 TetR/AcrR family transcriptional regulator [Fulvivirga ligni]